MSKHRPSNAPLSAAADASPGKSAKLQPGYWRNRIFKNTFTRAGKLFSVARWSVKIQHLGRRITFSLRSKARAAAAREAHHLYQAIVSQGWDAVIKESLTHSSSAAATAEKTPTGFLSGTDVEYWKPRLIHRKYTEDFQSGRGRELSVRIEHAGTSHYFPLETDDESQAALKALEIGRMIASHGWETVNQKFRRELTAAFHWADNPVAWIYTTVLTLPGPLLGQPPVKEKATLNVAIVESDAGIRHALAGCVHRHDGFSCSTGFASAGEALREIPRRRTHLVLVSHSLTDQAGASFLEDLTKLAPQVTGLIYSVYEDSDQVFRSTPGGADGYLLKRTLPHRILEPIAATMAAGDISREQIAIGIRNYFQRLFAAWPAIGAVQEMSKLTPREHEILALLSKGYVDKEIADSLRISIWTVHGHMKNIFEKLEVHTRTEAVVKYLQK